MDERPPSPAPRSEGAAGLPDASPRRLPPWKAVLLGHLLVNLPILALMMLAGALGWLSGNLIAMVCAVPAAAACGWVWWAYTVPRWRRWANHRTLDPSGVQRLAELTGLVWPKGFFLEKTEFRLRD